MAVPAHHIVIEPPAFETPPYPPDVFVGRVVLVSGGGSGMGLAMAMAFAQGGASVAVMGRSIERAEGGAQKIAALGGKVHALSCEVRRPEQVAAAFDEAERVLGPVSLLANNAGANFPVLAEAISENAWNAVTRIAIDGTFLCSTELVRRLVSKNFSVREVPIVFRDRELGTSKMSTRIIVESMLLVTRWGVGDIVHRRRPGRAR